MKAIASLGCAIDVFNSIDRFIGLKSLLCEMINLDIEAKKQL